ncbi:MAG: alcohol dehydrogenase catalytic domain-containing protein [Firmicutes bacterium]|nr:alcohol dehydrogenase catalytic domain-containing protein [Bacillota bacterium]
MKAAIYHGVKNVTIEEIPKPELIPGSVIVKLMRAGICGTDIYAFNIDGPEMNVLPGHKFGHEMAGIVDEVAPDVEGIEFGDHVYVNPMNYRDPTPDLSREAGCSMAGSFAEYFRVEHAKYNYNLEKLDPEMPWELAAMIEPCAVAYETLTKHKITPDSKIVIYGGGKIGQSALALLKTMGVKEVIVTARNPLRGGTIEKIGGILCDTTKQPAPDFIKEYWGKGIGNCNEETWLADFTIDAGGWHGALEELIEHAQAASDIAVVALGMTQQKICEVDLVNKGISIHGAYAYTPEDCQEVIKLIEKAPENFAPLTTATFPLTDIVHALEEATDSTKHMKVLLDCEK